MGGAQGGSFRTACATGRWGRRWEVKKNRRHLNLYYAKSHVEGGIEWGDSVPLLREENREEGYND